MRIGIALGGGGVRGFAHIGVLKALEEKGIRPDIISGVSAGAIVGAFIASGYTYEKTLKILKNKSLMAYSKLHYPKYGLFGLNGLKEDIQKHIKIKEIENLKIPLFITVSNLNDGRVEYIKEGDLSTYLLASASIPVLFAPVLIDGKMYSDGGLFDNLPISPLLQKCDVIIAVNVSPVHKIEKFDNLVQVASRTFQLGVHSNIIRHKEKCSLFIEPTGLREYEILNGNHAQEIFELGYNYTKNLEIAPFE
ncbi:MULTISPECIES: patatin-like phospholipase family protein [Labilibaculum]|uniref:Patatin n=2 Tax=Labilibaculum TaxID=2060722 RepID=A0A7M4D999_9BACT|nr:MULTISPECIES: patatin-like phospholipase family protein [Labilibaculum]MUP39228.1 patatin [Labilibaculum euxinus]MVB08433.1 patatin [Labilibaculum euxinus]PKQ69421.1 patatin [Labilibaculum manganireducens]